MLDDEPVRGFCWAATREAAAIGARIGSDVQESPMDPHAVTRKLGAARTLMVQDVKVLRPLELDALGSAVRESSQRVGIETPISSAL